MPNLSGLVWNLTVTGWELAVRLVTWIRSVVSCPVTSGYGSIWSSFSANMGWLSGRPTGGQETGCVMVVLGSGLIPLGRSSAKFATSLLAAQGASETTTLKDLVSRPAVGITGQVRVPSAPGVMPSEALPGTNVVPKGTISTSFPVTAGQAVLLLIR